MAKPVDPIQQPLQTAVALHRAGRLDEAEHLYRQLLADSPRDCALLHLLGVLLQQTHRTIEAIDRLSAAVKIQPDFAEAWNNLAVALNAAGKLDEAAAACRRAIQLKPDYAAAHINLGISLRELGNVDEALITLTEAIRLQPKSAAAHENLAHALKAAGRIDAAIDRFNTAIKLNPTDPALHSSQLYCLNYSSSTDAAAMRDRLREWNDRHAEPLRLQITPHPNDRDPHRRLRVGYVSSNFRAHSLAIFGLPIFQHHDRRQVEIFCYADVSQPDPLTERFGQHADQWRPLVGMNDHQVAHMIRADRIDILVDLNLHLPGNRLLVFARKPAPVQVTYLGYPGSTGLATMDYRLTDPFLDPPEQGDDLYCERSIRLANSFWCYDPPNGDDTPPGPPPMAANGYVTFGCLNNFAKINTDVLSLFAQVMAAVPGSRLLLLCPSPVGRVAVCDFLNSRGIQPSRLECVGFQKRPAYLQTFNRIDISLDVLPYNGHTTSMDSLWMGAAVITLAGNTVVGRAGVSILSNLGLQDLIADSPRRYVEIAQALSSDLERLSQLRHTLRQRMLASPLMDAPRFVGDIEFALRSMWKNWCPAGNDGHAQN